ncbi:MAG: thymidylate kinase [Acidobacteria bacterium]|nr:thymidylate kinase [Acidobacteriota bacterium]
MKKQCYGNPPPGVKLENLRGALIVIEGADSSGRSTQIAELSEWLEQKGYAVARSGLTRSILVGSDLDKAKEGNVLSPRTMSLFYATDFYDQLENSIIPALRAGYIVLADRYIYTLIARDSIRGGNPGWLDSLYSQALMPNAVFFLMTSTRNLMERTLSTHYRLDYWESGMDLGLSRDWYESFILYQRRLRTEFKKLQQRYGFEMINANRSVSAIQKELRARVDIVLERVYQRA